MTMCYDKDGTPISMKQWAEKFENLDYKRIDLYQGWFVTVSTVWLGLNHNFMMTGKPVIFETMVFPKGLMTDLECQRYRTIEEAKKGHKELVKQYRYRIDLLIRSWIKEVCDESGLHIRQM